MHPALFYLEPRRYASPSALRGVLELIAGAPGALIMLVGAGLCCWLVACPPEHLPARRSQGALVGAVALLLMLGRWCLRTLHTGSAGASLDTVLGTVIGGMLIGIPLVLLGFLGAHLTVYSLFSA